MNIYQSATLFIYVMNPKEINQKCHLFSAWFSWKKYINSKIHVSSRNQMK